jgi:hypothetical protein
MHAPPSALKTCRSPAESYFRAGQGRLGAQKVARYNADGSFDAGFGAGGVASTQVQDNDSSAVLLTQPDGKILAIGSAQNTTTGVVDVLLVRYLAS